MTQEGYMETFINSNDKIFIKATTKHIPKSALGILNRISKKDLSPVHSNTIVARDRIAAMLDMFYFAHVSNLTALKDISEVRISKTDLLAIFRNTSRVSYTIDLLIDNGILYRGGNYSAGLKAQAYGLQGNRINKDFIPYIITSDIQTRYELALSKKRRTYLAKNPIAYNYIMSAFKTILPTEEDALTHAGELVARSWSNHGKVLAWDKDRRKNDKSNERLMAAGNDPIKYSYVSVGLKFLQRIKTEGYMLPKISHFKAGGRVATSFNLMPNWMRGMISINNEELVEVDFSALHPNLILGMFSDTTDTIDHKKVAIYLDIPVQVAKIQHLSYFNKPSTSAAKMAIHKFYVDNYPEVVKAVEELKTSTHYKRMSKVLFTEEVNIMREALIRLGSDASNVMYVYDAWLVPNRIANRVQRTMEEVAQDMGYNLNAKISK